ncbi:hypothetical protein SKAU_G00249800 [Synaphobranchus kaupii]|uniref:Integrase p58-like C-terminal domain-containing protein n=1 Tax=Synaphobranchus kaupii TaxID=118154 RepID=A0A9Q1IRR7_SYNKA|nr:hypothetical protein SKAU_G00249800 [Synaphobranchus kaupii]
MRNCVISHFETSELMSEEEERQPAAQPIKNSMEDGTFVAFCHFLADLFTSISHYSLLLQRNDVILPQKLWQLDPNLVVNSLSSRQPWRNSTNRWKEKMRQKVKYQVKLQSWLKVNQCAPRLQKAIVLTCEFTVKHLKTRFGSLLEENTKETPIAKAVRCFTVFNHDSWPDDKQELLNHGEEVDFLLEHFSTVLSSRIGMDLVGLLPRSSRGHQYILVVLDYATRGLGTAAVTPSNYGGTRGGGKRTDGDDLAYGKRTHGGGPNGTGHRVYVYNRGAQPREFAPGDKVLVLVPTSECKFLAKWNGPYEVIEKVGTVNYRVRQPGRRPPTKVYHVNLLKKWVAREVLFSIKSPQVAVKTEPVKVQMGEQLTPSERQDLQDLVNRNRGRIFYRGRAHRPDPAPDRHGARKTGKTEAIQDHRGQKRSHRGRGPELPMGTRTHFRGETPWVPGPPALLVGAEGGVCGSRRG